ncbi:MAG: transposase [Zetaproteobacteria bacterium CG12_big_fil_rev_8_21_14_0_65_55_1124]|nr:MAG: transposase [Zetaproteobacteria bacterium CG1_02_55_237]PIS18356.1 MAG: transposase [Zetaproteobacteria bacterium CG08_land_8_20_14_0_20_55_17]PIW43318.1 MAG: transposase [Zetaproteobacteria bacterium CG12_big_fil_rev_8_21_14_0_65_55_1124]PIY52172.1 MAG: transposase [Zetaproteobacteria bacterium CG_4_10_14_0_8_um_filter_55_43]PIZ37722.1 MAG: transposase [Zetaproteobacteria bacterium CG_4_10_14_0_2_um_filter_55_20]PJB79553.1 MAG: transposase [Zetaproteobacteria bacterium CG_4_9_14_0_8_u
MPRANRHHIPGQIWHITHRCHQRQFLLRFSKDRKRWLQWLFEAKKRFGLSILDYMVTSNHIHLLVVDDESNAISKSLQLIAGRTAQGFNQRKGRKGAFWEDRYHATAIEGGEYLLRCLVYIDMNMVRAGVVSHPSEWPHSGYLDIQTPPERYGLIDLERLIEITGTASHEQLKEQHRDWVDQAVRGDANARHIEWTEAVAVGSIGFVEDLKARLGYAVAGRRVQPAGGTQMLREPELAYGAHLGAEKQCLSLENTVYFDINNEESIC